MSDTAETGAASVYDAWYRTPLGGACHRIEHELVMALAAPCPGELALDAGCGTGLYTRSLVEQGLDVTGIDAEPAMLAAARERVPTATLLEGDITALPFPDARFDLVLAITVLCFLDPEQRATAARELLRVLRPGGRVVIGELARTSLWALQRRIKGWRGSATWQHAHFSTAHELETLLRRAGATTVTSRHALYLPPLDTPLVTRHADAIERAGRHLGPLGAAFVTACADTLHHPAAHPPGSSP